VAELLKMTVQQTLHEIAKFNFILEQGRKGNHLLFSSEIIRGAFSKSQPELMSLFQAKLDDINGALNQTFALSSFEEKRNYIDSLPPDVQHAMVFGYFQLLEGTNETVEAEALVN
jgi:hypothetical protein